ncbi:MAG: hypothetical protein J5646_00420 [Bacteroidales bacterium]|nr:hypothetical protein [Bacteroidales bacterium]
MKRILILVASVLLLALPFGAGAQDTNGLPPEVYYLLPSFSTGTVYFKGKAPAEGELNICALDHKLRFIEPGTGRELEVINVDEVVMVYIDGIRFLRYKEAFYRQYPVSMDMGVALKRDVKDMRKVRKGAYGNAANSSAVHQGSWTLYTDDLPYQVSSDKVEYDIDERVYLYKGNEVYTFTKANLRKLLPEKKAVIDAWFKGPHTLPENAQEAVELLDSWMKAN